MSVKRSAEATNAVDEPITRVFDAPRALVFEVWTHAEHFARWFGPHGAEVVDCELDARPGGLIRFGHRFAGGPTFYVKGTFAEVIPDKRLVLRFGFVDERGQPVLHPMFPDWGLDVLIEMSVDLDDAGDGTRVTLVHGVLPLEAASHPATQRWAPMARQGSTEVLERLAEHLVSRSEV